MYYLYARNNMIIGLVVLAPFVVKGWDMSTAITTRQLL